MTDKQRRCIDWICEMLEIEFTGTTKKEAWEFINQYKYEADNLRNTYRFDDSDYLFTPDEGYFC